MDQTKLKVTKGRQIKGRAEINNTENRKITGN